MVPDFYFEALVLKNQFTQMLTHQHVTTVPKLKSTSVLINMELQNTQGF